MGFEKKIGILGGGQLGRMLQEKALSYGLSLSFLDPDESCSCAAFGDYLTIGDYKNYEDVYQFGLNHDVLTIEIEHVNTDALKDLESQGVKVIPNADCIRMLQNKATQKQFYTQYEIPTAPYRIISSDRVTTTDFLPAYQKSQRDGYDGKGVVWLDPDNLNSAQLGVPSILEKPISIAKELAITYTRDAQGKINLYPICEMVFDPELNLVKYLIVPADITEDQYDIISGLAIKIAQALESEGVFSIEFFLTHGGDILVNEMAPRAHNSAHYTIEGCNLSQFEAQLRLLLGLSIPEINLRMPSSMVNVLGAEGYRGAPVLVGIEKLLHLSEAHIHLYGKKETRSGRKMGHLTLLNHDLNALKKDTEYIISQLKMISHDS